jgi:hypothetical protein
MKEYYFIRKIGSESYIYYSPNTTLNFGYILHNGKIGACLFEYETAKKWVELNKGLEMVKLEGKIQSVNNN